MEKELKSCTGVLLRADLTGHSHSSPFCQNGWDGHALLGQPSPVQDFNHFPIMFYCIISTTYQKIGDLFCPAHISGLSHSVYTANGPLFFKEDFSMLSHFTHQIYWESTITFKKNCFHSHIKIA